MMERQLPAEVKRDVERVRNGLIFSSASMVAFIGVCFYSLLLLFLSGNYAQVAVLGTLLAVLVWKWFPAGMYYAIEGFSAKDLINERYARVEGLYAKGLRILDRMPLTDNYWKAAMLFQVGRMRMFQGFFDGAETPMERGLEIALKDKHLKHSSFVAMLHANLGMAYVRAQRIIEAEMQFEQAMSAFPPDSKLTNHQKPLIASCKAYVNISIGAAKFELGDLDSAYEHVVIGMTVLQSGKPPEPLQLIHVRQTMLHSHAMLALIEMRKGDLKEANEHLQRFFRVVATDAPLITSSHLRVLTLLADECINAEKFETAEQILNVAYRVGHESSHHPDAQHLLDIFEKLLVLTDRKDEVSDMRSWLRAGTAISII